MTPRFFGQHSRQAPHPEIRPFWAEWTERRETEFYMPLAVAADCERRTVPATENSPFAYEEEPSDCRADVGMRERRFDAVRLRHGHARLSRMVRHLFDDA